MNTFPESWVYLTACLMRVLPDCLPCSAYEFRSLEYTQTYYWPNWPGLHGGTYCAHNESLSLLIVTEGHHHDPLLCHLHRLALALLTLPV